MKTKLLSLLLLVTFFISPDLFAQDADKFLGYWLTQDGDSQVKIFKAKDGKYYGDIKWLKTPNEPDGTAKLDKNNSDEKLKKRPVLGLQILKSFEYNAKDKEWVNGTIYDPKNGKTYKCFIRFKEGDEKTLLVKGFIGFSLLGREVVWQKEEKLRE
ncbi:MAG: hypothetical protein A2X13_07865 [Bacteroidetes bacterium GWC2_33_15]|nr:MAG: hypothetical protein A2X10_04920 [Bacteroidetes bacterium GWA2_33_15]OFX52667.1 MAG: hypothetical protein A2X13_07865 [Bacteroidetes bacterium GWC2_33_15]OFX64027.1 MAG: hypothetical protein A2X15_02470 [Bacteroidetes bacterium GWB2_32_14]OFX67288.1 MAG: hypothetical protein A2X14_11945 [Bacteroidetes bacterium GWD2_33_33]HAN18853.1 DUF2147 domain-containing protein [Bacteroidales bacterium]